MDTTTLLTNLRDTLESIRQNGPEHFDMSNWFIDAECGNVGLHYANLITMTEGCGTTGCLAGHAAMAARKQGVWNHDWSPETAADFLGISTEMFFTSSWSEEMSARYEHLRWNENYDSNTAEWMIVIEFLEGKIKDTEAKWIEEYVQAGGS